MKNTPLSSLRVFNALSNIAKREFIGIDSSGNNLKLAYVKAQGPSKGEVAGLLTRNISGLGEDEISRVVSGAVKEWKARNYAIANVIPSHQAITKNIEIPSTDPAEIREIINLQAARHTPYSRDEIIVDYVDLGTHKHNYTKILLVIVARKVVKRQFEILEKAGLKSEKVVFVPEALAWFFSRVLRVEASNSPLNIVHVDESFTDFMVVIKEKLLFTRSLPIGALHLIGEKEKYLMKFIEELKRSLEVYQSEDIDKTPGVMVLTGALGGLDDLEAVLRASLHLSIRSAPYFKSLTVSSDILRSASLTKEVSFLNVIAPCFAHDAVKVNLIPEEIKLKKLVEERGRDLIRTGALVFALFVLVFLTLVTRLYFKTAYLSVLDKRYKPLSQQTQKLEKDFTKASMVKSYLAGRGWPLEVLAELLAIAPEDLELDDIRADEQGRFSVRGTADTMSTVFTFVDSMEKSRYFKEVKTKYTRKRKDGMRDVADFEIAAQLNKEPAK